MPSTAKMHPEDRRGGAPCDSLHDLDDLDSGVVQSRDEHRQDRVDRRIVGSGGQCLLELVGRGVGAERQRRVDPVNPPWSLRRRP